MERMVLKGGGPMLSGGQQSMLEQIHKVCLQRYYIQAPFDDGFLYFSCRQLPW
jgi:hypothetical protein